ncbi:class I SAM-dependent methyltransferase [Limnohabitans sp. WS1]|uniref:class I SAM-dependent methyltransferase n=1 Tax=Limnohabitans sp. WS1 TaxID=1100726 RepID=UPI0011B1D5D3|nr:class I SAM-dependent methyltransferase [Limnohabitans sp. WS1]
MFFANRTASVFCIESNAEWAHAINSKLNEQGIRTVSVVVHQFDPVDAAGFAQSPFIRAIGSQRPDVIVIDGYEESAPLRPMCFSIAEENIAPGGMIIIDDSWRYPIIRKSSKAKSWREFRSVGPCRYGVTTTDIHFY